MEYVLSANDGSLSIISNDKIIKNMYVLFFYTFKSKTVCIFRFYVELYFVKLRIIINLLKINKYQYEFLKNVLEFF